MATTAKKSRINTAALQLPKTTQAVTWSRYGAPEDVLTVSKVNRPMIGPDQVLVKAHAAGLNPYDWHFYRGDPYLVRIGRGFREPKKRELLGADFAGEVAAVGANVTGFAVGDRVYGETDLGALAEYVAIEPKHLAQMPAGLSFEDAAALPMGAFTALAALRTVASVEGKTVLINGASGGIGHLAVQIAKAEGAAKVVGVCSGRNAQWVRELGADHVVDYTQEDYTELGEQFDLFIDTQYSQSWRASLRAIKPGGTFAFAGGGGGKTFGPAGPMFRVMLGGLFSRRRTRGVFAGRKGADLEYVTSLVEAGKLRPVVEQSYPLECIVEACQHLESGHVAGKVVVTVP